jgi:hypothetical protein
MDGLCETFFTHLQVATIAIRNGMTQRHETKYITKCKFCYTADRADAKTLATIPLFAFCITVFRGWDVCSRYKQVRTNFK